MRNASSDIQPITEIFRKSLVTDPPRSMVDGLHPCDGTPPGDKTELSLSAGEKTCP